MNEGRDVLITVGFLVELALVGHLDLVRLGAGGDYRRVFSEGVSNYHYLLILIIINN